MPLYDFVCDECGAQFETLVRKESDIATVECPKCSTTKIQRQLSLPAAPMQLSQAPVGGGCGSGPPCGASWCQRKI